ncbi:MAG: OmpH family outer membrane protein [Chitinophagaceae bacterium]
MKKVLFLVCIAVAATFTQKAAAQAGAVKIAYVSVDEVVQLMPEYKKAMLDLSGYDSALQINYAETVQELNRQDSLFKADSVKWSSAVKTAKRENMRKLFTDLQGFEQSYQQQMQQKNEELLAPVAQKANSLIQEVAKAAGYTHVFRKEALMMYPESDDLLPLVKKKLGPSAVTPPAKPATGAPKR